MTRFWLVRHAPTHAKCMIGWTDLPADLSDSAALQRLHQYLPEKAPVISSDLSRAVATADFLGRVRLPHDPDLREMHFGAWETRSFAEIEAETPELINAFWEHPGDVRPPGGESWNRLLARSVTALKRLQGLAPDIIVVAHFGPILCALQTALGISTEEAFAQRIDNLSVTSLSLTPAQTFEINYLP
ncbi:histidine phosphatase family protein [Xinfangfangia sp. CPCC 101601]|uniref:Histidine phosphatase family protein n=1 Tax=Pseudogemmobacter lacusdianii TaxID=3069608 RepID=A0ABU0W031_9RHOB|nr:histidine phosphatase family protein [Xinfangfangia sp. CPCC 101601]MDQ2067353.1 histidine phosphatase family protein [Xinfangfangia sp. CPCC 101601]